MVGKAGINAGFRALAATDLIVKLFAKNCQFSAVSSNILYIEEDFSVRKHKGARQTEE